MFVQTLRQLIIADGFDSLDALQPAGVTLPVTLVNIQINSLNHELYGAGADLTGQYAYYHLCTSTNLTQTVNGITTRQISVGCTLAELGELPTEVNYLYLQSAAIDHQNNYAWFTYKEDATGRPRILEYHQDSHVVRYGHADSLPENAVFSSLIQTAPRIFFALFPPSLLYARFNAAGTKLFLSFDAATLRGAAPIDTNADDIPDSFNEADKAYQFSQPSSDFAIVEPPLEIPTPVAEIGGMRYIDVCTDLTLDGTQSRNHGYRGTFTWALSSTNPVKPEPHIRQLQKVIDDEMLAALPAELLELLDCLQQGECWSCWSFECNELTLQYVL
ncbi:Cysteine--tRNA ligase [Durusdinium trenchii]|uniref:Cysteine--tRNA ligase n=1 Tax=Durusdinium trenchii TaxID=1381693 RepID=A0ABP0RMC2_9DINO